MKGSLRFEPKTEGRGYQSASIARLQDLEYAGVFHEQGLGKTRVGLAIALYWMEQEYVDTILVVTKKMIVKTWIDEVRKHTRLQGEELGPSMSRAGVALTGSGRFFITNYEQIERLKELLSAWVKARRVGIILDESHAIKNPERGASKALMEMREAFVRRLVMTGTPSANRPYDLWNQIRFLDGGEAFGKGYKETKKELDLPKNSDEARTFHGRLTAVENQLRSFTDRITKQGSGIELPPKEYHVWDANLERAQRLLYEDYVAEARVLVGQNSGLEFDETESVLKRIGRMLQCIANPRSLDRGYGGQPGKDEVLEEILSREVAGAKVIVWTSYKENAERLGQLLGKERSTVVHGGLDSKTRWRRLEKFNREHTGPQILVATAGSCKEGLTLTCASHVIYYDRSLSMDDYEQSQDRIHRISQTRTCHVHVIVARNTVDEWVDVLLETKKEAAKVVQGDEDSGQQVDWTRQRELLQQVLGQGDEGR